MVIVVVVVVVVVAVVVVVLLVVVVVLKTGKLISFIFKLFNSNCILKRFIFYIILIWLYIVDNEINLAVDMA